MVWWTLAGPSSNQMPARRSMPHASATDLMSLRIAEHQWQRDRSNAAPAAASVAAWPRTMPNAHAPDRMTNTQSEAGRAR